MTTTYEFPSLVVDGLVKVLVLLDHHLDLLLLAVDVVGLQEVFAVAHPVLGLLAIPASKMENNI